jgi:alpha-L-fucosidase
MEYLQASVSLLCKNYGKIGGIWFDGMWAYWDNDWQEDKLYGMIRSYQPDAMIINNTGMSNRGELGHIELDSVTFERDNPQPLNMEGAPKYVASEMCEVFGSHWGYAKDDLFYKSPAQLIETLAVCRKCGSNMLLNVGPMGDGYLRPLDAASLEMIGQWVARHEEAIRAPRPAGIEVEGKPNDFLLRDGNTYYLFCIGLPMTADLNVQLGIDGNYESTFCLDG